MQTLLALLVGIFLGTTFSLKMAKLIRAKQRKEVQKRNKTKTKKGENNR